MQCVYGYKDDVLVLVDQLYHLLRMAVDIGAQQSGKASHSVIYVYDIVAGLYRAQFLERQRNTTATSTLAT